MNEVKVIDSFSGENRFLSNFYPCNMTYNGQKFDSAEAAFQCQKCALEEDKKIFTRLEPREAKTHGKFVKLRKDWEEVKVQIMEEVVRAKFTQVKSLGEALVNTGDAILIEGNRWRDTFWGVYEGVGQNMLGKILMKIRNELTRN